MRRATTLVYQKGIDYINFNPRSPCGERQQKQLGEYGGGNFNPRSPCGEPYVNPNEIFQSTLSMRRATVSGHRRMVFFKFQSTLSMRRATLFEIIIGGFKDISIHALHAESDMRFRFLQYPLFYFNPRSPCGERHGFSGIFVLHHLISIHALHAESDVAVAHFMYQYFLFQSTLSMRRATKDSFGEMQMPAISIHALHAESDFAPKL